MGLYLKIAVGLLLLVQVFHLGSFQNTTDSLRRTINKNWLREPAKYTAASQNAVITEEELDGGSTNDDSSGIASGSMTIFNEGEENVTRQDKHVKETSPNPTAVTTTLPSKFPTSDTTTIAPPTNATSDPSNSRQVNKKVAEEEFQNSTATPQSSKTDLSTQNSTSSSVNSHVDSQKTTSAQESNNTQESTTKPNSKGLTTESTKTTTATPTTPTMKQEKNKTSTKSSSTMVFTSETTVAPIILEKSTKTDKDAGTGSNSERGLATDNHNSKRNGAWGAVLGTAVAVACVGLVAYIILKKKHQKGFSHRKLNEDYPSEPVHRLDNGTPLDLNFGVGGSAYYNPGLQGDNIQLSNFPGRR